LEAISQTQITQTWGKIKSKAEELYPNTQIKDLCCVKDHNPPFVQENAGDDDIEEWVKTFLIDGKFSFYT